MINLRYFTFVLITSGLLGSKLLSIRSIVGQISLYRIMIIISPIIILAKYILQKNEFSKIKNSEVSIFYLLWAIYSVMQVAIIGDLIRWARVFWFFISGVITILFSLQYLRNKSDILKILKILLIVIIIYQVFAFYEILSGNYIFENEYNQDYYSTALANIGIRIPISLCGNPNDFGLFCIMAFYVALSYNKIFKKRLGKAISFLLEITSIFLVFATQSRGNIIGLLISIPFLLIMQYKIEIAWKRIILVFLIVFIVMYVFLITPIYNEVIKELVTIDFRAKSGSIYIRENLIRNGLIYLKKYFYMGVGLGNIEFHMGINPIFDVGKYRNIHNWWMEILVSSGLFIFIGYVYIYVKTSINLIEIYKNFKDKDFKFLAISFFCYMIAFIVGSISSSTIIDVEWIWVFWAIIYSFINIYKINKEGI